MIKVTGKDSDPHSDSSSESHSESPKTPKVEPEDDVLVAIPVRRSTRTIRKNKRYYCSDLQAVDSESESDSESALPRGNDEALGKASTIAVSHCPLSVQ